MNTQQIQQIAQQAAAKTGQAARFNLQNVQQHEHGGIGSRPVAQPTLTYAGVINTDGSAALLPKGWLVSSNGAGVYTIVHGLGTMLYSVSTTPLDALASGSIPQVLQAQNEFIVTMFAPIGGANQTNFSFILVNVNNKSNQPPSYVGTLTTGGGYS